MLLSDIFSPRFFLKLQQLKIHSRRSYLGTRQGSHISKKRGHGLEFADYRSYVPGDDFRHIDWGVYGRTDRLYLREFREEQELQILFLVDPSGSMAHPKEKFEMARALSVALAYVALSNGDTAIFSFLGKKLTPKYLGVRSLGRIWNDIKGVVPGEKLLLDRQIKLSLGRLRIPGKAFLISDLLLPIEEFVRACEAVQAKNFELTVIQVLAPEELKLKTDGVSSLLVDAESGEQLDLALGSGLEYHYAKALSKHLHEIERFCQTRGIGYALVSSGQDIQEVVLQTLPALGLLK